MFIKLKCLRGQVVAVLGGINLDPSVRDEIYKIEDVNAVNTLLDSGWSNPLFFPILDATYFDMSIWMEESENSE